MAYDGLEQEVTSIGNVIQLTKQPNEKFTVRFDFTNWLNARTTIASVASPVILPVDGTNAPTATATVDADNKHVSVVFNVGTVIWNTTGKGTVDFLVTMANGDKKEVNCAVTIVDIV